jgi:hypothetical protein
MGSDTINDGELSKQQTECAAYAKQRFEQTCINDGVHEAQVSVSGRYELGTRMTIVPSLLACGLFDPEDLLLHLGPVNRLL